MRQLGEQWIEELDGKMHMLKAVDNTYNCNGCAYLGDTGKCLHSSILECPVYRLDAIIKDLGPVNEDGCLPAPWDSTKYPKITVLIGNVYNIEVMDGFWFMQVRGNTLEKAIERWNRRAM